MLAQKLILSYSSGIALQIMQIAVTVVVARIAGPTVIGTVAFGLAFVKMYTFIADLGTGTAHIKLISEGNDEAACIGTFARIKLVLICAFIIVVVSVFIVQKFIFNYEFESEVHEQVIILLIIVFTIELIFTIPKTTFAAKTEQTKQSVPDLIYSIIFQILRLSVVLLGYAALAIVLSKLVSVLIMIPVYYFLFKNYKIGKFDKKLAKKYIAISLPVIIIGISQTLIYHTDKVILQYFTNSEQVGYYAAGFRMGGFILLIGSSVGILFFPMFSKAISENNYSQVNIQINKFERFSVIFIFPLVVFIAIYSDLIVKFILGQQYINSIPILSVITISMFIMIFSLPYHSVMGAKGLFKFSAKLNVLQLIFFIITAFFLVSSLAFELKALGLALSLFFANIFQTVLFIIFSKKKLAQLNVLPGINILLFGILYSLVSYYLYNHIFLDLLPKILFIFIFFIFYWGFLILFRMTKKEDWLVLKNLINVKRMRKYINSEMQTKNEEDINE